ncbi:hypothetical protein GCM10017744_077150 [Streptomyces antimycoticus]|uniref:Uncharacterized protein n=1 Tax=Streptomyces antimycoticus TaxID=68175 RepID=A0A4D4K5C3_9ACTN|nr:hypothetical protein SANT12839_024290 [Streptomyces antimycoticus]
MVDLPGAKHPMYQGSIMTYGARETGGVCRGRRRSAVTCCREGPKMGSEPVHRRAQKVNGPGF